MHNYNSPKVSVIMPVYNSDKYVEEAINSILTQTFSNFELLIFNDGSTDNSSKIINSINDERIRFYDYKINKGYVNLLNEGLLLANGEYIARMDSDDISLPDRFSKQVDFLDNNINVGLCGTSFLAFGSHCFTADMPVDDLDIREMMLTANPIGHPTVMMRKSIIDLYGLQYDVEKMPVEDYFFWYDISKVTQLHNLPDILLKYRRHVSQVSVVMNERQRTKVDELRINQLLDKGFILSEKDKNMYCTLVNNSIELDTIYEFMEIVGLMKSLTVQNNKLKSYRPIVFKKIFSVSWNRLIKEISIYNPKYISYIMGINSYGINHLTLIEKIKLSLKSILFWKNKID